MGFKISGSLEVTLRFNGVEYPIASGNQLNYLKINENTKLYLPTICLSITDGADTLLNTGLSDGMLIEVSIVSKDEVMHTCSFILYSYKTEWNGSCYTYEIDGYYNAPRFWAGTAKRPYNGSSTSILQQLAQDCGLKFQGDGTSDNRTFSCLATQNRVLAKTVCNTAWGGENACYKLGVTLGGVLLFKNVTRLNQPKYNFLAYNQSKNAITVTNFTVSSTSGMANDAGGYYSTSIIQSVVEKPEVVSNVTVDTKVTNPNVNADIRSKVATGEKVFSPISASEGWNKNFKAKYYNTRIGRLFSIQAKFLVADPTTVTLFDVVNFSATGQDETPDIPVSGKYIITSRTISIIGNQYMELFVATRMGTNAR